MAISTQVLRMMTWCKRDKEKLNHLKNRLNLWVKPIMVTLLEKLLFTRWLKPLNLSSVLFLTLLHIFVFGLFPWPMVSLLRYSWTSFSKWFWKPMAHSWPLSWVFSYGQLFGRSHLVFLWSWICLSASFIAFVSIGSSSRTNSSRVKDTLSSHIPTLLFSKKY